MNIEIYSVGILHSNSYLLTEGDSAVLIDCGAPLLSLDKRIAELGKKLKAILLTHGHCDHMSALAHYAQLCKNDEVCAAIHSADAPALSDPDFGLNSKYGKFYPFTEYKGKTVTVRDGDNLSFGNINISVIHTPGHTKGSVCYLNGEDLFSGDTLFKESVGRTDLPGGNGEQMISSLKKLAELDGNITVFPGHGEKTTIEYEKKNNPYIGYSEF